MATPSNININEILYQAILYNGSASISGTVYRDSIPDGPHLVRLYDINGNKVSSVMCDDSGTYSFNYLDSDRQNFFTVIAYDRKTPSQQAAASDKITPE